MRQGLALDSLVQHLTHAGLPSSWYSIPSFDGYQALTDGKRVDVQCVEACLGSSSEKPGYSAYGIAQIFSPTYPSLAFTFLIELRDSDREPSEESAKFSVEVDKKFSTIFLPALYTSFNELDPTGSKRGLLVQSYNSEMTLRDFFLASLYTVQLLLRYKRDGQLAMIAVDYYDPLTVFIAKVMQFTRRLLGGDIHLVSRTNALSSLKIPIRKSDGDYYLIQNSSTALDMGFAIAYSYLDKHYQNAGLVNNIDAQN